MNFILSCLKVKDLPLSLIFRFPNVIWKLYIHLYLKAELPSHSLPHANIRNWLGVSLNKANNKIKTAL